MELRQLKTLVIVAEVGNFTRAAELLHLVQPSVTKQMAALERELGVALFDRTRHGVVLTDAGRVLVDRAERILHDLDRVRSEVIASRTALGGAVAVGLPESTAELLSEPLLAALRRAHPQIELRLVTGHTDLLRRGLHDGGLDIALLCNVSESPSLRIVPLLTERLWAVASAETGLRPDTPITLAELARHPLVTQEIGDPLRSLVDAAATGRSIVFTVAAQANSLSLLKKLVTRGHGWATLPGVALGDEAARAGLSAAPLRDPEIERRVALATARSKIPAAATEYVARELIWVARTAVEEGRWPSADLVLPRVPDLADTA
ncbi:LysR family transcriptional regulator [Nocardia sp. BMG111209]|uniref:LysR family transcriptional regulator n=1 Tax=Nocardia sp. BMG111209 TaxID=1160137 RepID=UPI00035CF2E7|nr:LysR family transcriptional regulator [Nocardia sp. BMG111209]